MASITWLALVPCVSFMMKKWRLFGFQWSISPIKLPFKSFPLSSFPSRKYVVIQRPIDPYHQQLLSKITLGVLWLYHSFCKISVPSFDPSLYALIFCFYLCSITSRVNTRLSVVSSPLQGEHRWKPLRFQTFNRRKILAPNYFKLGWRRWRIVMKVSVLFHESIINLKVLKER